MEIKKIKMDQEGFEQYLKQIEKLEEELSQTRLYKGKTAIFQGDNWHDNPELYQTEARERSLMQQITQMRANAQNIEIVERNSDVSIIDIGDFVTLDMIYSESNVEEMFLKLVGGEANFRGDVPEISINSPLGKSIYQKKVGDRASYQVNGRIFNVLIKGKELTQERNASKEFERKLKK